MSMGRIDARAGRLAGAARLAAVFLAALFLAVVLRAAVFLAAGIFRLLSSSTKVTSIVGAGRLFGQTRRIFTTVQMSVSASRRISLTQQLVERDASLITVQIAVL